MIKYNGRNERAPQIHTSKWNSHWTFVWCTVYWIQIQQNTMASRDSGIQALNKLQRITAKVFQLKLIYYYYSFPRFSWIFSCFQYYFYCDDNIHACCCYCWANRCVYACPAIKWKCIPFTRIFLLLSNNEPKVTNKRKQETRIKIKHNNNAAMGNGWMGGLKG